MASRRARRPRSRLTAAAVASLLLGLLAACSATADDARVLQTLNQRGFGRTTLDANRQYYIGIGDSLVLRDINHAEYNNIAERVRMDGTITLPQVGEVYVNGLTPAEASEVVQLRYSDFVKDVSGMEVNVQQITSKYFYVVTVQKRLARRVAFTGDILLIDAMERSLFDPIQTNTSSVKVIRGDPENPLVLTCDYDEIIERGYTRDNILIRENDVIYLTPSLIGRVTGVIQILLAPLKPLQQFIQGLNNTIAITESFGQGTVGFGQGNQFGGGFGGGFNNNN